MPNPNQRAGRDWEETVARYLRDNGFPAADTIRVRHPDRGDIGGVPDWTLECKAIGPRNGAPTTVQAAFAQLYPGALATTPDTPRRAFAAGWAAAQAAAPRFDMAAAMDQLGKARAQAATPYGAVIRKRRAHGVDRGFMIVEFAPGVAMMRRLAEEGNA